MDSREILASVPDELDMDLVVMTPEWASELLSRNKTNRPVSDYNLGRLVDSMESGEYVFTGATVSVDRNGNLLDGQHRLEACVKTGQSFNVIMVSGLDPATQDFMDQGKKRTLADQLARRGVTDAHRVSAALNSYHLLINRMDMKQHRSAFLSPADGIRMWNEHPEIKESTKRTATVCSKFRIPAGMVSSLHYAFSQSDDTDEDVDYFFEALNSGEAIEVGDPIRVLRERLITHAAATSENKMKSQRISAYFIKAWNYMQEGQSIRSLTWSPGGKRKEPFPSIRGFEGYLKARV